MKDVKQLTIDSIRVLSAEAIQKAKSGHPGLPLGAAPIGFSVFTNMVFNPKDPDFDNRDRFVLSAGHGSMLLYSLLYLFGYKINIEDIKNFRQLNSITTGHPEYGVCPGVETSTGPLGQGIANAVGMAISETILAEKFNKENFPLVDHYTFVLTGDGCMQEGIENEAASLAGHLKLGKLIVLYDNNDITIEGKTNITFTEDVGKRHEALGWQVLKVNDACDVNAINKAIKKAKAEKNKPSLIIVKSVIGYGSPLAGTSKCHGAPLGEDNISALKDTLGYNYAPFEVDEQVFSYCKKFANKGRRAQKAWKELFKAYSEKYPDLAKEYLCWKERKLPDFENQEDLWVYEKPQGSRDYGNIVLNKIARQVPNMFGGSADLGPTNKSELKDAGDYSPENRLGRNMHFGIREHAMCAIVNGMYLHGFIIPYCATFAIFSDYMKHAMRMASLMNLPIPYILSHDSIGVGEDGPTHQPIEQLAGLRAMPGIKVFRPADGKETTAGWCSAMKNEGPTALFLSRQTLPFIEGTGKGALKGGYVVSDCQGKPDVILIGTGSELNLAVSAKDVLEKDGVKTRVVSMPCMELFDAQPKKYRDSVLPPSVKNRVAIEAGSTDCWYKYVGLDGKVIGMTSFGASAPANLLFEKFGFTVDNLVATAKSLVK